MEYSFINTAYKYIALLCLLAGYSIVHAQTTPQTVPNNPSKDTSMNKTNTSKWREEEPRVYYEKLDSRRIYYPDTSLHTFQRNKFTQPWWQDMGNLGSPVYNLMFTPEYRLGPTLGYHVFDVYRFNPDSLNYYNTARPYSVFNYQLGSKLEQAASIMHSQNIRPNWNVTAEYRKINSPGFYKIQRNNHDNASLTTNYKSLDKHYVLYAAMVYNKEQHDENGGIVNDSELLNPSYNDRRTVDAAYQSDAYSITRSSVYNIQRDFSFLLQHSYTWGRMDTTYNSDSTQYSYKLAPQFSITHKLTASTERHTFNDLSPDSMRYTSLFNQSFANRGTGSYLLGGDSVFAQQNWFWIDNLFMLNGFAGKADDPLQFSAGIGNRYDQFISRPVSFPHLDSLGNNYFTYGADKSSMFSTYLSGEIRKEALQPGVWEYGVNAKLFVTGLDAGNFALNAVIGKQLKNNAASFVAGCGQAVNTAPYSYTNYENAFTQNFYHFNKESVTSVYATLESPRFRFSGGLKNYIIGNYIYVNDSAIPTQYSSAFNITELWARKVFRVRSFYLDNEVVYQQITGDAPVNIPAFMGRHQLSYESTLFKTRLKIAAGIEVRYTTNYKPAGYDALLNKFYYQNTYTVSNAPQAALFLNFRIKRFRAFIMGDNLQQIFSRNTLLYIGSPVRDFNGSPSNYISTYAAPDALIRFGFSWVLVN